MSLCYVALNILFLVRDSYCINENCRAVVKIAINIRNHISDEKFDHMHLHNGSYGKRSSLVIVIYTCTIKINFHPTRLLTLFYNYRIPTAPFRGRP